MTRANRIDQTMLQIEPWRASPHGLHERLKQRTVNTTPASIEHRLRLGQRNRPCWGWGAVVLLVIAPDCEAV
jgi:hypothetical protein